jgi:His-Xaa-Ser system protein HxsD
MPDANIPEEELPYYLQKLERDLVDFHLRDLVSKETGNIRTLLVAKAFSNGEFDEAPPGEVSDPVGFAPLM